MHDLWQKIHNILLYHQVDNGGWTPITKICDNTIEYYKQWLKNGSNGDMAYLERHLEAKFDVTKVFPNAKSVIVIAQSYGSQPTSTSDSQSDSDLNSNFHYDAFPIKHLKIAKYAIGEDYHRWFLKKLQKIALKLADAFPQDSFYYCCDSYPVLEKEWAYRAGLGWFGKNTCLIHEKKGSFFLIGEIFTSIQTKTTHNMFIQKTDVPNTQQIPNPDRCGKCQKCIDICPTKALRAPRIIDATRCISYLTIESRKSIPEDLRLKTNGYFFGCDLCQIVCPWNKKTLTHNCDYAYDNNNHIDHINYNCHSDHINYSDHKNSVYQSKLSQEISWILLASNKSLKNTFYSTALWRAGSYGLKRNALLVAAFYKLKDLCPVIENVIINNEKLKELATWTIDIVNHPSLKGRA